MIPRFVLDGVFVLADLAAIHLVAPIRHSADADLFQLVLYAVFLAYALAVRTSCRVRAVYEGWKRLDDAHHDGLSLFRIMHILFLLALPIALFFTNLQSGARGDELFLALSFIVLPWLAIFTIRQVSRDPSAEANGSGRLFLAVRLVFLLTFVVFNTITLEAGNLLALLLSKELYGPDTIGAAWFFTLAIRLFFVCFFFLPMRLWLAMPALAGKSRGALAGPLAAALLILVNGFL